jgi:hypothetical protein
MTGPLSIPRFQTGMSTGRGLEKTDCVQCFRKQYGEITPKYEK